MSSFEDEIVSSLARDRLTEAAHLAATAYMKKLRLERIAMHALAGLLANPETNTDADAVIRGAVSAAKALIAELDRAEQSETGGPS